MNAYRVESDLPKCNCGTVAMLNSPYCTRCTERGREATIGTRACDGEGCGAIESISRNGKKITVSMRWNDGRTGSCDISRVRRREP